MINFNIAFTIISVICYLIMSQELGRLGNEKLLNQLDQAVFIIKENMQQLMFSNKAAWKHNIFTALRKESDKEPKDEDSLLMSKKDSKFVQIEKEVLFSNLNLSY